jgi:hypothetical protein
MQKNGNTDNPNVPAKEECRKCERAQWAAEFLKKQPCDACKKNASKN